MDDSSFKVRDAASYDDAAERYGNYIELLAAPLAVEACRLAGVTPGDRVLDLGCGTGIAARKAAKLVGAAGSVVGIDLSDGMLDVARRRSEDVPWQGVLRFERMDAEALAFDDGSFDSVVSLCAVTHFPRVDRALHEMRRVLRPGGTLVVSIGAGRPGTPLGLARHIARRVGSRLASRLRPELRAPAFLLALALEQLAAPEEPTLTTWAEARSPLAHLRNEVRAAGFERIDESWVGRDTPFDSIAEFWGAQTAIITEVRKRLAVADAAAIDRLRRRFDAEAGRVLARGGKLVYPYGASFLRVTIKGREIPSASSV